MNKLIVLVLLLLGFVTACTSKNETNDMVVSENSPVKELQIIDQKIGEGKLAHNSMRMAVHYSGWLYDEAAADKKGSKFDSSHDRKRPLVFSLGNKDVIQGWEQGILGMKAGGVRTLIVPPHLAYGAKGYPPIIPPNSALIFEIELLKAG